MKKKRNKVREREYHDLTGTLHFHRTGSATLVTGTGKKEESYRVQARDTGTAMHLDEVKAKATIKKPGQRRRRKPKTEVVPKVKVRVEKVIKRARESLVGTLFSDGARFFVVPNDPRIPLNIKVAKSDIQALNPRPRVHDKVVTQLKEWKDASQSPKGTITEVLGKSHTPVAEYRAILREFNLDPDFPQKVLNETNKVAPKVSGKEIRGRYDARKLFTLTIDPDDAKDFDDALSLQQLDKGQLRVGVHIADVSHYVKPGSALDVDAKNRGNSTYLVGTVIPMLPHPLSSGICSLVEEEDRLVKSVFLTFGSGKLVKTEFENSVIRSRKRLTYRQAIALLKEDNIKTIRKIPVPPSHQTGFPGKDLSKLPDREIRSLQKALRQFWKIASHLRRQRMDNGSLDLDMPETKIFVDKNGWADRIEKIENDESHQLIEEFMLLANEEVAKLLRTKNIPGIFRVHDDPEEEKLNEFRESLKQWDIHVGDLTQRKEVTKALAEIKRHPQRHLLHVEFLRSLQKACYRAAPDGHYGLNKGDYTHFTSPIRRYSDLVVHRIIDNYISRKKGKSEVAETKALRKGRLEDLGQHLSLTERNSITAERESVKIKLMEFFERELKKNPKTRFSAVIMEIGRRGVFVELKDSGAYGMISVGNSGRGRSWSSEDPGASITFKGRTLRSGEEIDVVVESVDRFQKQMNFAIPMDAGKRKTRRKKG